MKQELYIIEGIGRHYEDRDHLLGVLLGPPGQDLEALANEFMQEFDIDSAFMELETAEEWAEQRAPNREESWRLESARKIEVQEALARRLAEIEGLRGYLTGPAPDNDDVDEAFVAWLRARKGFSDAPHTGIQLGIGYDRQRRGQEAVYPRFVVHVQPPENPLPLLIDVLSRPARE